MRLRTTSSAIATGSMAAPSRADCAPWASGTSLPHLPHYGRMPSPNGWSGRSADHIVVFGEAHLRRILRSYARYLYEGLACQEVFSRLTFLLFLSRGLARAQFCIDGTAVPFAWPRRAVNPRSPEGRAGRREGLTAKARAEQQWCSAITLHR